MRQPTDKVQIKEPPLQELNKKRSCLKRSCFTGCGCIALFLIGSLLLIRFATTPRLKELKHVPDQVETAVPLYDSDSLERITLTPGKERGKAIVSPLRVIRERRFQWSELKQLINEPSAEQRDLVQMDWRDLPAAAAFIASYYSTELKKYSFAVTSTAENKKNHQLSFVKDEIDGMVDIRGGPEDEGTESVRVTINIKLE